MTTESANTFNENLTHAGAVTIDITLPFFKTKIETKQTVLCVSKKKTTVPREQGK